MILADRGALDHRDRAAYRWGSRATMRATVPRERGKRPPPRDRSACNSGDPPGAAWNEHMIHPRAFAAQIGSCGPRLVLVALWDFSGWRPGSDPRPFVWPTRETLAGKLGGPSRSALDRSLRVLEAEGWITPETCDGHDGWRLTPEPERAAPQLDLFASEPVDNLGTDDASDAQKSAKLGEKAARSAQKSAVLPFEQNEHHERADDDDAQRIWLAYEADRVRLLGGSPRGGTAPPLLRALIRSHGLAVVETYATRSLALARDAVDRARQCAPALVAARADGREWTIPRLEAVAAFPDPVGPVTRAPPPPEPTAAGERVTLHEREAFDRGGEAAVLAQRRALAERPHAGVAHIDDWLRRMGGGA